jgi:hypothetical protein
MKKLIIFLLAVLLILPANGLAKVGVGIGIGKIKVHKPLRAGQIYNLPSLPVLNTGDKVFDFETTVQYHQGQETKSDMGLKPVKEWFDFNPQSFSLKPGEVKNVAIKLSLPLKIKPGNYFAYLEARPVKKTETGGVSIGIAAAAKLYFTVVPANIWQGIYYRLASFWKMYTPWTWIVLMLVITAALIIFFKKHFSLQIGIKKK